MKSITLIKTKGTMRIFIVFGWVISISRYDGITKLRGKREA